MEKINQTNVVFWLYMLEEVCLEGNARWGRVTIQQYTISTVRTTAFTKPSYGKRDFAKAESCKAEKKEEDT